jgi:hypothetical protein
MQGEMRKADLHYSILDCNIEAEAATGRTSGIRLAPWLDKVAGRILKGEKPADLPNLTS